MVAVNTKTFRNQRYSVKTFMVLQVCKSFLLKLKSVMFNSTDWYHDFHLEYDNICQCAFPSDTAEIVYKDVTLLYIFFKDFSVLMKLFAKSKQFLICGFFSEFINHICFVCPQQWWSATAFKYLSWMCYWMRNYFHCRRHSE